VLAEKIPNGYIVHQGRDVPASSKVVDKAACSKSSPLHVRGFPVPTG